MRRLLVVGALKGIARNGEYVITDRKGQPVQQINKAFKRTGRRVGIAPASPHAMRHTFASPLMKPGVDPYTIMELGGWKSLEMVMRYSHLAPDHRQMAVNKLAGMQCLKNAAELLQYRPNQEAKGTSQGAVKFGSAPMAQMDTANVS